MQWWWIDGDDIVSSYEYPAIFCLVVVQTQMSFERFGDVRVSHDWYMCPANRALLSRILSSKSGAILDAIVCD